MKNFNKTDAFVEELGFLKGIVLDFDGLILESMNIKAEAFRHLFRHYPNHVERIVKLHLDHGGMSRFEKIRIIYRDFINKRVLTEDVEKLAKEFGNLVQEQMLVCPFVPGAEEFLKRYAERYNLFMASGTPEDELRNLVHSRGLSQFFKGVYGSPARKEQIINRIMADNSWQPHQLIFVGDAIDDQNGARETSVAFVDRIPPGGINNFSEDEILATISDMFELDRRWPMLMKQLVRRTTSTGWNL